MSYETGDEGGVEAKRELTEEGVWPVTSANVMRGAADVPGGTKDGASVEDGWKEGEHKKFREDRRWQGRHSRHHTGVTGETV